MECINELQKNSVLKSIIDYVEGEKVQEDTFVFTIGESTALYNVAFHVFNSFSNENNNLSKEMKVFLDDLSSALDKF